MHRPIRAGEEGVILADADVLAGHYFRSALADDNLSHTDFLAVRALNAEVFRIGIA